MYFIRLTDAGNVLLCTPGVALNQRAFLYGNTFCQSLFFGRMLFAFAVRCAFVICL